MSCSSLQHKDQYDQQAMTYGLVSEHKQMHGTPIRRETVLETMAPMDEMDMGNFADLQTAYLYTPTMAEFKNKIMHNNKIFQMESPPGIPIGVKPDMGHLMHKKEDSMKPDVLEINTNLNNLLSRHNNMPEMNSGSPFSLHEKGFIVHPVTRDADKPLRSDKIDDIISSVYNDRSRHTIPAKHMQSKSFRNNDDLYNMQLALEKKSGMSMLRLIIWIALIIAIIYGIYHIYDGSDVTGEDVSKFIVTLPSMQPDLNLHAFNSLNTIDI